MGDRLRNIIVAVVLIAWAAGLLVPMIFHDFTLDPVYVNTLNGAFMAIVGIAAMSYSHRPGQGGQPEDPRRNNETGPDNEETTV